jgi:hypothetical protein
MQRPLCAIMFIMKKVYLFILLSVLALGYAEGAPCYGTKMPEQWQWFWGTEANYIFNRDLERDLGDFRCGQSFITGTLGLTDWLCFDGAVGAGFINYDPMDTTEISFDTGFAGKYGFRIKLYDQQDCPFKAVFGFQHISVHPKRRIVNNVKREVIFDDWQASLIASYNDLGRFVPYAGGKVSRGDIIERQDSAHDRRKSDDDAAFGAVGGFYFFINDEWWITCEGRYFDEEAASFSLTHSF